MILVFIAFYMLTDPFEYIRQINKEYFVQLMTLDGYISISRDIKKISKDIAFWDNFYSYYNLWIILIVLSKSLKCTW